MDDSSGLGTSLSQIAANGNLLNQQIGELIKALTNLLPFGGAMGTFTCSAAATTTVTNVNVQANSVILPFPTNAAGATLMSGATSLYTSARTAGVSFALTTANAAAAAGTETFYYVILNPSS